MPDSDGVSEGFPIIEEKEELDMALAGSQIEKQMEQDFHNHNKALDQVVVKFMDGSAFVAEESKQGFLLQQKLIGAAAANTLETNGLADLVTQLKTANNQPPQTTAGNSDVK